MVLLVDRSNAAQHQALLDQMHRVRKQVFVDRRKWPLPVIDGQFEIDQYDTEHAIYLINEDKATGEHLASVRLLSSARPYLMGDIFPGLCQDGAPRCADTWEITRLCNTPGLERERARKARHKLAVALVEYAVLHGITRYTCMIEVANIPTLIAPGWCSTPLGPPKEIDGELVGAFSLAMSPTTLQLMIERWGGAFPVLEYPERKAA
jgi:acyl-homoserine lactone synthase